MRCAPPGRSLRGYGSLASFDAFRPEVQLQAIYAEMADEYRRSLYLTAKDLLGYRDMTQYTHGGIVAALQESSTRKLICVPRGCFKSSVAVVSYSIWLLLNHPNLRILLDSEKYENSKNFIREIKGKLKDDRVTKVFGELEGEKWGEGEITVRTRTQIYKEASITASGIGAGKTGQHYDVIIHDDMNSKDNSQTPESRQKIIDHYRMNTSILEPNGIMVVIGTRYAADDLIGWILENEVKVA